MRRRKIIVCCVILTALFVPLFAQAADTKPRGVYTKTFPVDKVLIHKYGYRVDYFTPKLDVASLFLKRELFSGASGKAVLVFGQGPEYPYLSVTWVEGRIDHVVVYTIENMNSIRWGILRGGEELKSKFPDEIEIAF